MTPLTNSFWAGSMFMLAGVLGLIRRWMLGHDAPCYPRAPWYVQQAVFMFSAILIYIGLRFVWVWATGEGVNIPPGASPIGVLMSLGTLLYKGALLYDVASQRYPVETWNRLNRVTDLARCSPRS